MDGARDLADSRFDRWVGEGLGLAKLHLGQRFDAQVTTFPPYRFIWAAGQGGKLLAGRLMPSEDGAGRKHPFAVFAYLDARRMAGTGPLLPVALLELQNPLDGLAQTASTLETPGQVVDLVRQVRATIQGDGRELTQRYERFLEERNGGEFWRDALGVVDGGGPLRYQVMQALVETLGPMKGRNPADIRIGIRFPLSAGNPQRAALEVAFWLDVTSRRLGKSLERASCFWSEPDARDGAGSTPASVEETRATPGPSPAAPGAAAARADLYVFFSEPSGPQWTCLVERDANIETVSFLDRPYGSDPAGRMDAGLKRLLDDPGRPLREYVQWARG